MSTPAQKFLQKLASSSSFDLNVTNIKPLNHHTSPASPATSHASTIKEREDQFSVEDELRLSTKEKRLLEEELRKNKNNLDAVVSELVLSENEIQAKTKEIAALRFELQKQIEAKKELTLAHANSLMKMEKENRSLKDDAGSASSSQEKLNEMQKKYEQLQRDAMRLKKKAELKIHTLKHENEATKNELKQVSDEKLVLQARVKELEAENSRQKDKLLERQNEIETMRLQQVTRSVSPAPRATTPPYPRSPSPPTRMYGHNDTSLVMGERERSPSKYNRSFEELKAKLEGRPFTPGKERPEPDHQEVHENGVSNHDGKRDKRSKRDLEEFLHLVEQVQASKSECARLKQQLDEANDSNEKLTKAVRSAEIAHRAASEQQEWFDDLRAQFEDLHRKYDAKLRLEEETKARLRELEKLAEQKTIELEDEKSKWESKLKKIASERENDITQQKQTLVEENQKLLDSLVQCQRLLKTARDEARTRSEEAMQAEQMLRELQMKAQEELQKWHRKVEILEQEREVLSSKISNVELMAQDALQNVEEYRMENHKLHSDLTTTQTSLASTLSDIHSEKDDLYLEKERALQKLDRVEAVRESLCAEVERLVREHSAAKDQWRSTHADAVRRNEELMKENQLLEAELHEESKKFGALEKQIKQLEKDKENAEMEVATLQARSLTLSKERDQFSDDFGSFITAHNQLQNLLEESNQALAKVSKELQTTKHELQEQGIQLRIFKEENSSLRSVSTSLEQEIKNQKTEIELLKATNATLEQASTKLQSECEVLKVINKTHEQLQLNLTAAAANPPHPTQPLPPATPSQAHLQKLESLNMELQELLNTTAAALVDTARKHEEARTELMMREREVEGLRWQVSVVQKRAEESYAVQEKMRVFIKDQEANIEGSKRRVVAETENIFNEMRAEMERTQFALKKEASRRVRELDAFARAVASAVGTSQAHELMLQSGITLENGSEGFNGGNSSGYFQDSFGSSGGGGLRKEDLWSSRSGPAKFT